MRARAVAAAALVGAAYVASGCSTSRTVRLAKEWAGGSTYRPEIQPLGWSAEGGGVLFVHTEERGGYDYRETVPCGGSGIYRTDGRSAPRPVLTGTAWCRGSISRRVRPFLSADRRTVFMVPEHGYGDCTQVHALDLGTRRWRRAIRICGSYVDDPAVSPDSGWIALSLSCGYGGGDPPSVTPRGCVDPDGDRLTLMRLDGTGRRVVGEPGDQDPVWSQDGQWLAVRPRTDGGAERIAVIHRATGRRRMVTHGSGPAWSPDGRWLAFTRFPGEPGAPVTLHVIRVDGTGERTVFTQTSRDMRSGPRYPSPGGWPRDPLWSPDGQRIVFTKHFQTGNTLWVVNADGTGLRRLSGRIEPR